MTEQWKHGGSFGFDKPTEDLDSCSDGRGVTHAITRNGTELRHFMQGSKNPRPWEKEGRIIPGEFSGSGSIELWQDGNLQVKWPNIHGKNQAWYIDPLKLDDPSVGPSPPYPVYPRREKYSLHLIDVFAYTYNHPNWDIEPLIDRASQTEASAIHSFGWAGDPNQQYDIEAIPWLWKNDKVDFFQKNPKYEVAF